MVVLTAIVGGITQIPHGNQDLHIMPEPPFYASTPQSPQPPQSIPSFEQAILDLTKIVDDFVAEHKGFNTHSNQRIVTVEDNLNKKLDGLKNDFEHKWDNLQDSIENLIDQQQCPLEEECQSDTMVEEGSGKETVEEPQELVLNPFPTNNPLPVAPSTDQVYIFPTPEAYPSPKTPSPKATQFVMPALQNLKKLVTTVQAYATTSKTLAVAQVVWHSGWFGCWFGFGAPEPWHFLASTVPTASKG